MVLDLGSCRNFPHDLGQVSEPLFSHLRVWKALPALFFPQGQGDLKGVEADKAKNLPGILVLGSGPHHHPGAQLSGSWSVMPPRH